MRKMKRKAAGIMIASALALSITIPAIQTNAASKVTYKLSGSTLTISGKGEMPKNMTFGTKKNTKNIKKVVIKKGVTTITKNAFKDCKNLKTVQMPSTITKISGYAFYNTALEKITIPNSVKYIGNYSFYKCKNLKQISTPADLTIYDREDSVGKLNDKPLNQLTFTSPIKDLYSISTAQFNTEAYVVSKDDSNYSSYKGAIYDKKGKTLEYIAIYAPEAEVKNSCETIFSSAFLHDIGDDSYVMVKNLKNFTIPENIKSITGDGDFPKDIKYIIKAKNLTQDSIITLINSLDYDEIKKSVLAERISINGDYVVLDNTYLLKFAEGVDIEQKKGEELIEIPEGIEKIANSVFSDFNMKEVKFPSTLKSIGDNAFYGCGNLYDIELPEGLESIGNGAFYNCRKLTKINFPSSLKEIKESAFTWTEIGACIPEKWLDKKDSFYHSLTETDKENKKYEKKHKNAASIECTTEQFINSWGYYNFDASMQDKFIALNMKASGIFYYYANQEVKLYDADKKEIHNCTKVKNGDTLYIKTPKKIEKTFKIKNAYICPELSKLELGFDSNGSYLMANGKTQYLPFEKASDSGILVRIVDLNVINNPNIKIEIQKKSGSDWISVSKEISIKNGKSFDQYTHMNGTTAKDIGLACKKGSYRLKFTAKKETVCQITANESYYYCLAKDNYGTTKAEAVELHKTDTDLEYNNAYYRYGTYYYEDKEDTRWYRFDKDNNKEGTLSIVNEMLSSGGFTATIYKKGVTKAIKTYVFDTKNMKDNSSDCKTVNYKLKSKGTYYIKITRLNKKVTGIYEVYFG